MIAGRPPATVVATNASPRLSTCPPIAPRRARRPRAAFVPIAGELCFRVAAARAPGGPAGRPAPASAARPRSGHPTVRGSVRRTAAAGGRRITLALALATPNPRALARTDPDTPPATPQVNRAGSYSLARQLGLGARKIVIDAGQGARSGTLGRGGLQEKDLVLDVAVRLQRLVRDELGAEVVMTRSTDVFVPLEERTAIANAQGADPVPLHPRQQQPQTRACAASRPTS